MQPERVEVDDFADFVSGFETGLRRALSAAFGAEVGREAAAEALAYGWEHWERVQAMDNSAGYLFTVGRDRARRMARTRPVRYPLPPEPRAPWVEPGLDEALAGLPERQRTTVLLLHGYEWTMSEVADMLGVSRTTVQKHAERALAKLRRRLGAEL